MFPDSFRPADTSSEAWQIQIACWRRLGPDGRLKQAIALCEASDELIKTGIRSRHPEYTARQVQLAAIKLKLPPDLFAAVYPEAVDLQP